MTLTRNMRPLWALALAISLLACEPQNTVVAPPTGTPGPTATALASGALPSTSAGTSQAPSGSSDGGAHVVGSPEVTVSGTTVRVTGLGSIQATPKFDLTGNVAFKLSACSSNGVYPFIWVYTEFNSQVGVYVEEVNHLKNAKGKYYMKVVSNPDCPWTITITPE